MLTTRPSRQRRTRRWKPPRPGLRGAGRLVIPVVCSAWFLFASADVSAQGGPPLDARGEQDLHFGDLLGGVAQAVSPLDPVQAGQFRVRPGNRTVEVGFLLPPQLVRNGGGQIPLQFGPGDGTYQGQGGGPLVPFNPSDPVLLEGSGGNWIWFYLGGTALTPAQAPLGAYSGTILITIADLGS